MCTKAALLAGREASLIAGGGWLSWELDTYSQGARPHRATPPNPLQVFFINIKLDKFAWTVYRRYSDFKALGEAVRRGAARDPAPVLCAPLPHA